MDSNYKFIIRGFLFLLIGFFSFGSHAQNFYKEKHPKTITVQLGLGVGRFFPAPRPFNDSLIGQVMPVISFGIGKRLGSYVSLKANASFQAFGVKEYIINEMGEGIFQPFTKGISYAIDIMPIFNLLPASHHLSRPKINFNLGIGIGYLTTYSSEKITFQDKEYTFNFLKHSPYVPVRSSIDYRLDNLTDLAVEGVFFNTWIESKGPITEIEKFGNHFGQVNFIIRRFIR